MVGTGNIEVELELTYLARAIPPETKSVIPIRLLDVYIPADPDVHSRLRLRQESDSRKITKKVVINEGDASAQHEYTIPLEANEFDALSPVSDKRVEKDRYRVSIEGHRAEVDIFRGALRGLVLIDFEFGSEQEKSEFTPPECCLADVTQEDFIAGGNLAGKTYSDVTAQLERFGYEPL
jgi:adenylate cyclase